ncbi:hypothetical protein [Helicobacter pylori]|uniref:hypothetical protein n=1 Tax=Helicobacter pylori TaxID=210 RepID=UPI00042E3473|nr:hypothetical protein [Helicobacter pylori]AHN38288.1 hypothetical protein HPOKI128_07445 [Helicobacter pylori oki128]AHN39528.1 hypothetical protein HPOKI154_06535 [Helicobacter pylori oki154]AHN42428.1 hypothetical protein HPOKI673_06510 [Helicobacter pylori oki673]AHN43869.1 hypothetical protein HPOKI828_06545 [Helicobacter pylori oki828]WRC31199.1 hypothetical protein KVD67_06210 [Helicobacter pylori]
MGIESSSFFNKTITKRLNQPISSMSKNTIHLTQSLVVGFLKIIKPIGNLNKNARNTAQLKGGIEASFEFILIF